MDHEETSLTTADWGLVAYAEALERQRALNAAVATGDAPPTLALLEHKPVITVTRRAGAHVIATPDRLAELGIAVHETDRGGDITYHGPGQLVAYPILRMGDYGLNLGRYMRLLERVVIETVDTFGIAAHTEPGVIGVWVTQQDGSTAKLCALGVRVRKNTTMHGLAINITTDLSHFQTIVPCGLHGRSVTSLAQLLGDRCPTIDEVKRTLAGVFDDALRRLAVAR